MQTDKDKHIQQLLEQHEEDMLTIRAIQLVMEDFMAKQKELEQKMADLIKNHDALNKQCEQLQAEREKRMAAEIKIQQLQKELSEKSKLCKSLERKLQSTQE